MPSGKYSTLRPNGHGGVMYGSVDNRPAKHGVLPGSVAGSKCTGKNYTGRIWELVSVSKFCPSFAQVSTVTPESPSFESLLSKAVKILATLQSLWSETVKIWPPSRPTL